MVCLRARKWTFVFRGGQGEYAIRIDVVNDRATLFRIGGFGLAGVGGPARLAPQFSMDSIALRFSESNVEEDPVSRSNERVAGHRLATETP